MIAERSVHSEGGGKKKKGKEVDVRTIKKERTDNMAVLHREEFFEALMRCGGSLRNERTRWGGRASDGECRAHRARRRRGAMGSKQHQPHQKGIGTFPIAKETRAYDSSDQHTFGSRLASPILDSERALRCNEKAVETPANADGRCESIPAQPMATVSR